MNQRIFRQFSIRGHAERDLPDEIVLRIGRAMGTWFSRRHASALVVGRDVRQSSPRISRTLIEGLAATGRTVIDVGLVPTPALNFAVDHLGAAGGIMVTASHNAAPDNGFKLRTDETLMGADLQEIYHLADREDFTSGNGIVLAQDILTPYLNALRQHAETNRPLKIVVDGGNGANGPLVSDFLRGQGHTVISVFADPDGAFPNRSPDPTTPDALRVAARAVIEGEADCGLAFDGDGDRIVLIDDQGAVHPGDTVLMLLARLAAKTAPVTVVHDAGCTRALADDVRAHGGKAIAAPVGYAFVHKTMREVGASLGGEASGHIFCIDDRFKFDDAILASVKLVNFIAGLNQPVSEIIAELPHYHTSPNERIACPDERKAAVITRVTEHFRADYPVDTIDGARIDFGRGWALIRQSNTQPALTLRAEAATKSEMERIKTQVLEAVLTELNKVSN